MTSLDLSTLRFSLIVTLYAIPMLVGAPVAPSSSIVLASAQQARGTTRGSIRPTGDNFGFALNDSLGLSRRFIHPGVSGWILFEVSGSDVYCDSVVSIQVCGCRR